MQVRGKIHNRERAQQQRDYSSIRFGNITPTDIDGLIEYKDKAYVIIELKWSDTPLSYGQRLALERLTDDLARTGKPILCIISSHYVDDSDFDINVSETIVREYRLKKAWHIPSHNFTTEAMIDKFLRSVDEK